jgi:hypothetical protein
MQLDIDICFTKKGDSDESPFFIDLIRPLEFKLTLDAAKSLQCKLNIPFTVRR